MIKTFEDMKKYIDEEKGWGDSIDDSITKIYVLQQIETDFYMYKPNQWGNTLTEDPRRAKTYTSEGG